MCPSTPPRYPSKSKIACKQIFKIITSKACSLILSFEIEGTAPNYTNLHFAILLFLSLLSVVLAIAFRSVAQQKAALRSRSLI